jgi:predicted permease
VLIAAQFALATILLTSAGLFLEGTIGMLAQDYGWRSDHVLQGNIQLPTDRYRDAASISVFYTRAVARLQQLPGVDAAAVSYGLPYLGLRGQSFYRADDGRGGPRVMAMLNGTSPAYFRVTGTRLVAGRAFTDADALGAPGVAIVSESLARALFPGQAALGRRLMTANDGNDPPVSMEVVGVAADTSPVDIARTPNPLQLYQPAAQDPRSPGTLALRTTGVPPDRLTNAMRAALSELDPDIVLTGVSTGEALVDSLVSQIVVVRQLLAGFAALGTFLALIGIYGVMSRMVAQRTAEIGIRMALGAQVRGVVRLIAGAGARVALAGAAVGLLGAVALSRIIANGFPGMDASPLPILAATIALLASTAFGVSLLSARRVSAIDPVVALRAE